ncbi:hypothetical protein [Staphylococcus aureus]|uniref:hypothetical protein n=1 Tax=Staphylococcus aureus TaxID=1280 RepID=UPI0021B40A58|nr:hypothetical protein [Staphylococcus aureus]
MSCWLDKKVGNGGEDSKRINVVGGENNEWRIGNKGEYVRLDGESGKVTLNGNSIKGN